MKKIMEALVSRTLFVSTLICLSTALRPRHQIPYHKAFDPRRERASLLHLDDLSSSTNESSSYSYLISLGKGDLHNIFDTIDSKSPTVDLIDAQSKTEVVKNVENLVRTLNEDFVEDASSFIDRNESNSEKLESRISKPSPSRHPVSVASHKRTSPNDIVGFSAVRASGFSREGNSRIYFENTVADTNYGWDKTHSMFITHFPGLYFFTFSVKADADESDNFKVSLMKNGEEVVSVGGAVDASMKNIGTSATNSVLLDLSKGDKVWLQLLRGGLVETTNRKTGYSSFSGYMLGCQKDAAMENDYHDHDTDYDGQHLDSFNGLHENEEPDVIIDRFDNSRPSYSQRPRPDAHKESNIYDDKYLYEAFGYQHESERDRPSHRPFDNNGPPIIDKNYRPGPHSGVQDGFGDYFKDKRYPNRNRYPDDTDKYNHHRDTYPEEHDNRYSHHRPWDRERPSHDNHHRNIYRDQDPSAFFQKRQFVDNDSSHLSYGK